MLKALRPPDDGRGQSVLAVGQFNLHLLPKPPYARLPMTKLKIAALAGDGIGPEVMRETLKVLRAVEARFSVKIEIHEAPVGWAGIDASGKALPDAALASCKKSDAILVRLGRFA